ncbi:nuclear transport factor 2 family protein [Novosphingobium bradum]|uniref:Nuclear transport factor 2 family protein n=1 Tax=Novosphingobium bradum TaxID=1737444 RepID=A0ABV7IXH3_9SPHN
MDAAEQLLAIEEIRKVKARRCRAVDTKDWDLYRDCHTVDCKSYALGSDADPVVGNEAMTQSVRKATEGKRTNHHVHNPEIELTSDTTATGIWAMEDVLFWEKDGKTKCLHGYGHYHETYEKVAGRWLIASRRLVRTNAYTVELPAGALF